MWYYIQDHFNSSRRKANECKDTLTGPAHIRHTANLSTFGQWQVLDDCGGSAKVQTTTGSEEYLVTLATRPACSCFELQETMWPCEHIMAWDDVLSKPFGARFHRTGRTSAWRALYEGMIIPSFLYNDITVSSRCWPPPVAKKKGRHRFARIKVGLRVRRTMQSGANVTRDALGNLFLQYAINDDGNLMDAMPTLGTFVARQNRATGASRKKAGGTKEKNKCKLRAKPGHNRRTCPTVREDRPGETTMKETEESVRLTALVSSQVVDMRDEEQPEASYRAHEEAVGVFHEFDYHVPQYLPSEIEGDKSDVDEW